MKSFIISFIDKYNTIIILWDACTSFSSQILYIKIYFGHCHLLAYQALDYIVVIYNQRGLYNMVNLPKRLYLIDYFDFTHVIVDRILIHMHFESRCES